MLAKVRSAAVQGISAVPVEVEVEAASDGLPGMVLVGLPDASVRESRERVRTALGHCGWKMPYRRITVSLAPADLRKVGSVYDLPIAVGLLAASEQLTSDRLETYALFGELALDGRLRPVPGVLPMSLAAREAGLQGVVVPADNAAEAGLVEGLCVVAAEDLREAAAFLAGGEARAVQGPDLRTLLARQAESFPDGDDYAEVRGQEGAKRALMVAAAGGHNLLMVGPPGTGKTMLARRLVGILPPLDPEEALEATAVHSVAGQLTSDRPLLTRRPFRAPHHTVSDAGLVGGGNPPRPGEISLAHHGVLFLDELPEFRRTVLEVLRQPLEEGRVVIGRAGGTADFPSRFMLVSAMNPCPCGFLTHPDRACHCNPAQVRRYLSRVSGPLLDRIDLHVEVAPVETTSLGKHAVGLGSAEMSLRVREARARQTHRYDGTGISCNAALGGKALERHAALDDQATGLLAAAMQELGLSARAHARVRKVARTIADLDGSQGVKALHVSEAIQYRSLDRDLL